MKKVNQSYDPLISICLISYNHQDYIKLAIESIINQKNIPNNSWELIIADDFSTDNSKNIILEFKKKFPKKIKLILQPKNIGAGKNFICLLEKAKGKYISYLEGDDLWTNDNKIQLQFNLLENNPKLVGCFGNSNIINDKGQIIEDLFLKNLVPDEISQKDLWNSDYLGQTGTWMFKRSVLEKINPLFYKYPWDRILQFGLADYGNWGYIDAILSSYRIHSTGSYSMVDSIKQLEYLNEINKIIFSNKLWRKKYNFILRKKLSYLNFEIYKSSNYKKNYFKKLISMINVLYYCESKVDAIKALLKNF